MESSSLISATDSKDAAYISLIEDDYLSASQLSDNVSVCQPLSSEPVSDIPAASKDLEKCSYLKPIYYVLNNGLVFL